jgi:hypothetical protein
MTQYQSSGLVFLGCTSPPDLAAIATAAAAAAEVKQAAAASNAIPKVSR